MTDLERYRRALEKIRDYSTVKARGYTDEWTEAEAFHECQQLALEALDPAAKEARIKAKREADAELRKQVNALSKQGRYWLRHSAITGVWVRFLRGDASSVGIVRVRVLEQADPILGRTYKKGEEIEVHVGNLRIHAE